MIQLRHKELFTFEAISKDSDRSAVSNGIKNLFKESNTQIAFLDEQRQAYLRPVEDPIRRGRCSEWPDPSLQAPFCERFMKFQGTVLSGLRRRYYTSANKVLRGSEADRKLDIFLTPADASLPDGEHDWPNVLVIGEHKHNPDEGRSAKTLVQLAAYAREVFGSQPGRRFMPGFTICGSMMRLWVFDRPVQLREVDIHKEPERYVKVLAGYAIMTDAGSDI
ncbi:hypothetical protein BKA61DRAFT_680664 [Leptodontidium sp. MPI-SDFR-AT-0119]|nr:hypothetical protein BKA61DRAFT_680664 [Leptodontidium sp. MPI-SDFR-AT-0119]